MNALLLIGSIWITRWRRFRIARPSHRSRAADSVRLVSTRRTRCTPERKPPPQAAQTGAPIRPANGRSEPRPHSSHPTRQANRARAVRVAKADVAHVDLLFSGTVCKYSPFGNAPGDRRSGPLLRCLHTFPEYRGRRCERRLANTQFGCSSSFCTRHVSSSAT